MITHVSLGFILCTKTLTLWLTQVSKTLKNFHSDSGGEYLSDDFRAYLVAQDTLLQLHYRRVPKIMVLLSASIARS